jgi:rhodanese-related sulfurtransferase
MRGFPARVRMGAIWVVCGLLGLTGAVPLVAGSPIMDVTVDQAQTLMQQRARQEGFVVLDVRTPGEFREGHLAGAVNVDSLAPDFAARLTAMDRAKSYLVYCRTGNRSTKAVHTMKQLGFRSVYHMNDGIVGWEKKGLALPRGE